MSPDRENALDLLFGQLSKLPSEPGSEATERIVTRGEGGSEQTWRLSGMDICPACRAVRDTFTLAGGDGPTARYCRLCKVVEVYGTGGALLFRKSDAEERRAILDTVAQGTLLGPVDDEEEE